MTKTTKNKNYCGLKCISCTLFKILKKNLFFKLNRQFKFKMSDEPSRKRWRTMQQIFLCNDIWWDCLPFLSRANVGLAFAFVSDHFDGLADAHLGSKKRPWTLGHLRITQKQGDAIILNWDTKKYLPLPDEPLPENVVGFKGLNICYINHDVIDFLCRICRLFQPTNNDNDGIGFELGIHPNEVRSWHVFRDSIWPLIDQSAITKLDLWADAFDTFRQRFSPTFLTDLANVRLVDGRWGIGFDNEPNGQLLRQWLNTPRADGKPKLLNVPMSQNSVEHFKTPFLNAETAVSYVIAMHCYGVVPFELDNLRTGERLTFRKVDKFDWLLERGPIGGRNVEQWAKWEREVMEHLSKQDNLLILSFGDNVIGPLSPP